MPSASKKHAPSLGDVDTAHVEGVLSSLVDRLPAAARSLPGQVVFRLTRPDVAFAIHCDDSGPRPAAPDPAAAVAPLIEVVGEARIVCAVLTGERDARRQYLEGGFVVRGNIPHLSTLAVQLGLLRTPL